MSCETTSAPTDFPVALVDRVTESALDAWDATFTGLADYWAGSARLTRELPQQGQEC